ncbi:MAG: hypothetical protein JNL11_03620 [Bdellovibrionaceae bacterium]|nr:hypothetical protein [Pseudobdellovibrionaceae bacterium]
MYFYLKNIRFLIIAVLVSVNSYAVSAELSKSQKECRKPLIVHDGAYLQLSYKYVYAQVKTEDLLEVVNSVGKHGVSGGVADDDSIRCTAVAQIASMEKSRVEDVLNLKLRVFGSCDNFDDFMTSLELQDKVMFNLIQAISKIEKLKIDSSDSSWGKIPPCPGGGVTGSN